MNGSTPSKPGRSDQPARDEREQEIAGQPEETPPAAMPGREARAGEPIETGPRHGPEGQRGANEDEPDRAAPSASEIGTGNVGDPGESGAGRSAREVE